MPAGPTPVYASNLKEVFRSCSENVKSGPACGLLYNALVAQKVLQTKLYIPSLRPNLVPRPRLTARLNQGLRLGHKLTLLSAPAGFGKTTLLSDWVHHPRSQREALPGAGQEDTPPGPGRPIADRTAWISLDEDDNDLARFLAYLVAALRTLLPGIGEGIRAMLQSPQQPPIEALLTPLLNELSAAPIDFLLVLDDYHLIGAREIDRALAYLLQHLPPQMHLVIATREDPQLPLSRLRASAQLSELRAADLRFDSSEAAVFLNEVMGLNLSNADIAALERRTEGWIAGLQLAALSIPQHKDAAAFITSFTGSHRYILDYLIEEVLEQQSQTIQNFLLVTAILDRFTGPLCDAMTGREDGQAILHRLERANLFIIALDNEGHWYRYHHLFGDLLRLRLRQTRQDQIPTLHGKASRWYEQNGYAGEAIEHALRAEDFERAAQLVAEVSEVVWQRGEYAKLRRWVQNMPLELVYSRPQLCIFHAEGLFLSGQQEAAEQALQAAEERLVPAGQVMVSAASPGRNQLSRSERMQLLGRVAATRAFFAFYRGDVPAIIRYSRRALEYLPQQDVAWRSSAANAVGDAHVISGNLIAAEEVEREALEKSRAAGNIFLTLITGAKLAITFRQRGRLQLAIETCRQQLQLAGDRGLSQTAVAGWLLAVWGEALAELDDLEQALHLARQGVELTSRARHGGDVAMLGWSFLCLARVLFSGGDMDAALETCGRIESMAFESDFPPWITGMTAAWQARIWLAKDEVEAASQWAEQRGLDAPGALLVADEIGFFSLFDHLILARTLLAQDRTTEAEELLAQLLKIAEMGGQTARVIETLILQALTHHAAGDVVRAMEAFHAALTLAEPCGFIRIFVDEGPPVAQLLRQSAALGLDSGYAGRLLAAFPVGEAPQTAPAALIEPLSERETEILQLISKGLTNQEIANRLFLALNTVKSHTRSIYGKLDVHNRTQAVARARTLGILPFS